MTATQTALTDLLVAAGVDRSAIGASPDGDTVVVEQSDDRRIVVGYDWTDHAPTWIDYTRFGPDDTVEGTDGAEPTAAAAAVARLVQS